MSASPPESPGITGSLSTTPLFVVLRRIQLERLSGTLSVFRDEQEAYDKKISEGIPGASEP